MDRRLKAWQVPPRLITGAYFINAGLSKRGADDATAGQLHGFAAGTYPVLGKLDANIGEVQHQRAFSSLSVERAQIEMVLHTRGAAHTEEILDAMRTHGYHAERIG